MYYILLITVHLWFISLLHISNQTYLPLLQCIHLLQQCQRPRVVCLCVLLTQWRVMTRARGKRGHSYIHLHPPGAPSLIGFIIIAVIQPYTCSPSLFRFIPISALRLRMRNLNYVWDQWWYGMMGEKWFHFF